MAMNGVTWRRRTEKRDGGFELSPSDSEEVHVLAVDDSLVDRKVIEKLLRNSSCKVTAVDSGRRALQFLGLDEEKRNSDFQYLKVDLIITDYCMPGMTGYELLKKIKESSAFREIPVVIMSSENVLTRIDRCLEEGAEDFIMKPVKLSDVKRLKDCMIREVRDRVGNREKEIGIGTNKRKHPDSSDDLSSSPPSISSSPSSSSPSVPSSLSAPCSPSTLDSSPTGRLKMTNSDRARRALSSI